MSNEAKARASLVLTKAFLEVAKIGTMGAGVYGDHDWQTNPSPWSKHLDAALRHMTEYNSGNRKDIDPKCEECKANTCKKHSSLSHLAHAAWRLLALLECEIQGIGEDDLFKGYEPKVEYETRIFIPAGADINDVMCGNIQWIPDDNK